MLLLPYAIVDTCFAVQDIDHQWTSTEQTKATLSNAVPLQPLFHSGGVVDERDSAAARAAPVRSILTLELRVIAVLAPVHKAAREWLPCSFQEPLVVVCTVLLWNWTYPKIGIGIKLTASGEGSLDKDWKSQITVTEWSVWLGCFP